MWRPSSDVQPPGQLLGAGGFGARDTGYLPDMAAKPTRLRGNVSRLTPAEMLGVIEDQVLAGDYPCLGARSAFRTGRATIGVFGELGAAADAPALTAQLTEFGRDVDLTGGFASFVAAFRGPVVRNERHFERLLWRELQAVHDQDRNPWATQVSPEPSSDHFGFSVGGRAYFVIGMHPCASRIARRMPFPILVFNPHEQFALLRASDRFTPIRDAIRRRDRRLQGDVNPMVDDHGRSSEARQYSGRAVGDGWAPEFQAHCPGPTNGTGEHD